MLRENLIIQKRCWQKIMHTVTDTHSLEQLSVNCGLIYGHFVHSRMGAITPSPCFFTSIKRRNLHVPFHLCCFLTCQNLQVCSSDCSRVCFSVCLSVFLSVCVFVGVNAVIQIQVAQLYNLANYYQTCLPVCSFYCLSVSNITGNPMHGDSWDFQDRFDMEQDTTWNIPGCSLNTDIFIFDFLSCVSMTVSNTAENLKDGFSWYFQDKSNIR